VAHYAIIDDSNIVINVIVGRDEDDLPEGINSWEEHFFETGQGRALRTSYNTRGNVHYNAETNEPSEDQSKAFRKNYAGIGFTYDEARDAFIPPQEFASWTLNEETCMWEAPVQMPDDVQPWIWDEASGSWVFIDDSEVE
jgi:hypothetical protein